MRQTKTLISHVLDGSFHSGRHKGLLLSEPLPEQPPVGVPPEDWAAVREAQEAVRAARPGERRRALAAFTDALSWMRRDEAPELDPIGLRLRFGMVTFEEARAVARSNREAEQILADVAVWEYTYRERMRAGEPVPLPPHSGRLIERLGEEHFGARARAGAVDWLAEEEQDTEANLRRLVELREREDREREEHIVRQIREYGIEEWHGYWGSTPMAERRRLIEAAASLPA